jgi:hypothetical protein
MSRSRPRPPMAPDETVAVQDIRTGISVALAKRRAIRRDRMQDDACPSQQTNELAVKPISYCVARAHGGRNVEF